MNNETSLAALAATRICHDLASPIGAIANVADMMREVAGQNDVEDLDLLRRTADRGAALLKFYRLVLGTKSSSEPGITVESFRAIAACQGVPNRITVEIETQHETISAQMAQLGGLLLMAGTALTGLRGEVKLTIDPSSESLAHLEIRGERAAITEDRRALLDGSVPLPEKASDIEFSLTNRAVIGMNAQLGITDETGAIDLTVTA
ncbi:hypothetical protein KHP62_07390 [Rhodobacteraceae bacterium NNCM2]|nr:hypothetical protein [Coraliihabitans acroporae]